MPGVLVVDDEADMRLLVEAVIERANEGLTVVGLAATGAEAIARWREIGPDVILLDQQMPDMTGLEAAGADPRRATRPTHHSVQRVPRRRDPSHGNRARDPGVRAQDRAVPDPRSTVEIRHGLSPRRGITPALLGGLIAVASLGGFWAARAATGGPDRRRDADRRVVGGGHRCRPPRCRRSTPRRGLGSGRRRPLALR